MNSCLSMTFNAALNPYVDRVRNHASIQKDCEALQLPAKTKRSIVDLGCGNGHFLQGLAKREAGSFMLGVERRFKRAFKSAEKVESPQESGVTNSAQVLQMDWLDFLSAMPAKVWDEIWLQFPDPWPKARHEKNRLITPLSFWLISRALKPEGRFCFRSDSLRYFETLLDLQQRHRRFAVAVFRKQDDLFENYPQTLFQRKFIEKGIPIHSARFERPVTGSFA